MMAIFKDTQRQVYLSIKKCFVANTPTRSRQVQRNFPSLASLRLARCVRENIYNK